MANNGAEERPSLRCGSIVVTKETDGFSVRSSADSDVVSLGRYPDFRDAVEIPLMMERSERIRGDLNRLQRCARQVGWDWSAVSASLLNGDSRGPWSQVA